MTSEYEALISELDGSIYRNVDGYDEKYFPSLARLRHLSVPQTNLSPAPLHSPSELIAWLNELDGEQNAKPQRKFVLNCSDEDINVATLCLTDTSDSRSELELCTTGVLVLGMVCREIGVSPSDEAILKFFTKVSTIFMARADRLFLHGFLIRDSIVETWTFDRAGVYSGKSFDMVKELGRFRGIINGYTSMNYGELGLNTFTKEDDHGSFLDVEFRGSSSHTRLSLEDDAFVKQDGLVGSGTTCFKAQAVDNSLDTGYVVKFTWIQTKEPAERRLLELAANRNVRGVIRLEAFHDLSNIALLRKDLLFGHPSTFSENLELSVSDSGSNEAMQPDLRVAAKFDNLFYICLVTSPLGRALDTFQSPSELFGVLRDAVGALHSLYFEANIIHRDISTRNIVIAEDVEKSNHPTGVLIDLGYALDIAQPPATRMLVGSQGFMAAGIMGGDEHTYRHDLESVFYVFLWLAVCHDGTSSEEIPLGSRLHAWCGSDFLSSFHAKMNDMEPREFSLWTGEEFSERFKPFFPLANTLHSLLFPLRKGKFYIGTDLDRAASEKLYQDMMAAFENYIDQ